MLQPIVHDINNSNPNNITNSKYQNQLNDLKLVLTKDIDACDMKWSLFVGAAQSYRCDSRLSPYPSKYSTSAAFTGGATGTATTAGGCGGGAAAASSSTTSSMSSSSTASSSIDKFNIENILNDISKVPRLDEILEFINDENIDITTREKNSDTQIDEDVIDLLHWVLCKLNDPSMQSVSRKNFENILDKVVSVLPKQRPTHIFEIVPHETSVAERKFQKHAVDRSKIFAFHGSAVDSFHSIMNHGLQQHLSKVALFGDGIYLSSEQHVSLLFSPSGSGWEYSRLGTQLTCIALCEFVDHPEHLKYQVQENNGQRNNNQNKVPDKYFVITNNEIIRVRYLLVFATNKSINNNRKKINNNVAGNKFNSTNPTGNNLLINQPRNKLFIWLAENKAIASMGFYIMILLAIGLANSDFGIYLRHVVLKKLFKNFNKLWESSFGSSAAGSAGGRDGNYYSDDDKIFIIK